MDIKKIIILGCTGSIGHSAIKVIRRFRDNFTITGLSAHTNERQLLSIADEFHVKNLALSGCVPDSSSIKYYKESGLLEMIEDTDADIVLNGISGAAGLMPSVSAVSSCKDLALANKETIVMAGPLIRELAVEKGCRILPVDSEHSAIFNLLKNIPLKNIEEIIITASGGAFRNTPYKKLQHATLEDALKHPTWNMGKKITIDSATMANKGLEIIEAHQLFSIAVSKIKVTIHPQSYVHSLIRTIDGSLYTQISLPDMQIPIQNALTYPELFTFGSDRLDFTDLTFNFTSPDTKRYPMLSIGYTAAEKGGAYPLVYNAANEQAVYAFIDGRISFLDISGIVTETLESGWDNLITSFSDVHFLDKNAREKSEAVIKRYENK